MDTKLAEAVSSAAAALRALAEDLRQCAHPTAAQAAAEAAVAVEAAVEAEAAVAALDTASEALDQGSADLFEVYVQGGSQAWCAWLLGRMGAADAAAAAAAAAENRE